MVNYQLRDKLMILTVCLYNPLETPGEQFSTDTLHNYLLDCEWQIKHGEQVKRFPFYVSPIKIDAERAIDDLRRELQSQRKEQQTGQTIEEKPVEKQSKGSWGYTGGMPFEQPKRNRGKAERL